MCVCECVHIGKMTDTFVYGFKDIYMQILALCEPLRVCANISIILCLYAGTERDLLEKNQKLQKEVEELKKTNDKVLIFNIKSQLVFFP